MRRQGRPDRCRSRRRREFKCGAIDPHGPARLRCDCAGTNVAEKDCRFRWTELPSGSYWCGVPLMIWTCLRDIALAAGIALIVTPWLPGPASAQAPSDLA